MKARHFIVTLFAATLISAVAAIAGIAAVPEAGKNVDCAGKTCPVAARPAAGGTIILARKKTGQMECQMCMEGCNNTDACRARCIAKGSC